MIKNLVSTLLVFRLESQLLTVDPSLIFMAWLQRPVIEVMFDRFERKSQLVRKLDQIYPF